MLCFLLICLRGYYVFILPVFAREAPGDGPELTLAFLVGPFKDEPQ